MSSDDWIAIVRDDDNRFNGYWCCASVEYPEIDDIKKQPLMFIADDFLDAIKKAERENTEYGYSFVHDISKRMKTFVKIRDETGVTVEQQVMLHDKGYRIVKA